jgi:hypothetical protein
MVQDQGLDVYLAPFGNITNRYQQHSVPAGSPNFTGDPNEVYIEAVDGERFIIVTDLMKWFDMKGATHLCITYDIDQARGASGRACYRSLTELEARRPVEMRLKGRQILESTSRKMDGAWSWCGFVFASLVMGNASCFLRWVVTAADYRADEELDMATDEIARDVDMHGKIVVTVSRGNLVKRTKQCDSGEAKLWKGYDAPDTKILSKQVVKDSRVSHAVK